MEPDEAPAAPEPQKPKPPRKPRRKRGPLSVEDAHVARQLWMHVSKRDDIIARMVGVTVTAVKHAREEGNWANRTADPWPGDVELDRHFLADLKKAQDRFNEASFGAACDLMEFIGIGAKRLKEGARDVPMAGVKGEDTLMGRLAAAPPLAQVFQTGRVVTGQSSDKQELGADDTVAAAFTSAAESASRLLVGSGDGDGVSTPQPAAPHPGQPEPVPPNRRG